MSLFKKKVKKTNDYYDNYTNRYKDGFIGGLVWAALIAAIYGIYKLMEYLFL